MKSSTIGMKRLKNSVVGSRMMCRNSLRTTEAARCQENPTRGRGDVTAVALGIFDLFRFFRASRLLKNWDRHLALARFLGVSNRRLGASPIFQHAPSARRRRHPGSVAPATA